MMDPLLVVQKRGSVYDSFTFAAFPQWRKQQKRRWREEGEREGALKKMMRRLFLEAAD